MAFNTKSVFGISEKQRSKREKENQRILATCMNGANKKPKDNGVVLTLQKQSTQKVAIG